MPVFSVRVIPNSSSNRIGKSRKLQNSDDEQLVVYVTAVPEDGKANAAVIKLLASHFGVAKKDIAILAGIKCKNKVIQVKEQQCDT